MASVVEIERAIAALPLDELAELRAWFEEYEAAAWDRQLEEDARSGKLDALADEAIEDYRKGRCKEL
jgi:hypothetical protein